MRMLKGETANRRRAWGRGVMLRVLVLLAGTALVIVTALAASLPVLRARPAQALRAN